MSKEKQHDKSLHVSNVQMRKKEKKKQNIQAESVRAFIMSEKGKVTKQTLNNYQSSYFSFYLAVFNGNYHCKHKVIIFIFSVMLKLKRNIRNNLLLILITIKRWFISGHIFEVLQKVP